VTSGTSILADYNKKKVKQGRIKKIIATAFNIIMSFRTKFSEQK
jgi:hypothetical protein